MQHRGAPATPIPLARAPQAGCAKRLDAKHVNTRIIAPSRSRLCASGGRAHQQDTMLAWIQLLVYPLTTASYVEGVVVKLQDDADLPLSMAPSNLPCRSGWTRSERGECVKLPWVDYVSCSSEKAQGACSQQWLKKHCSMTCSGELRISGHDAVKQTGRSSIERAADRKWEQKCQKIKEFDKLDKISPQDCRTLLWAAKHCDDCRAVVAADSTVSVKCGVNGEDHSNAGCLMECRFEQPSHRQIQVTKWRSNCWLNCRQYLHRHAIVPPRGHSADARPLVRMMSTHPARHWPHPMCHPHAAIG
jgi:hypothetical protein